jgi:cysteine desulfurase
MIYLDYNATSPISPEVREAVSKAMEAGGNPSSVHAEGRNARRLVEEAREKVASLLGAKPSQVVFTSGGTEANNQALKRGDARSLLISSIEHESILTFKDRAVLLPVTSDGLIDIDEADRLMDVVPRNSLVAVMMANNETGVIQPVEQLARRAREKGHLFHTDAVQAAGRLKIDFQKLGATSLSISAHKIGGPQGVGALVVDEEWAPDALLLGGGQERNRRSGTENVAGIVGFGVAAELAAKNLEQVSGLSELRDRLETALCDIGGDRVCAFGKQAPRLSNTIYLGLRNVPAETQVVALDLAGVAVSAGSACSSGKVRQSTVLKAMGLGEEWVGSAVRYSLGWKTSPSDIDGCIAAWREMFKRTAA